MMKITCNIINDMLPLYVDGVASNDTAAMVEDHLAGCAECTEKCEIMKQELDIRDMENAAKAEKESLVAAKKRLRKKRTVTAILSVIAGAIILSFFIRAMNLVKIPIEYEEGRFEVVVREEGGEDCLFLRYKGKMSGHEMVVVSQANSGEETLYIELYTTPWRNLFGGDEDQVRNEIFCGGLNFGDDKVTELRLIEGDIRQFYEATRDYENLEEDSVLLWHPGDTSNVTVTPVESEIFTQEDIAAAEQVIINEFNDWNGCTLTEIRYAGDDRKDEFKKWEEIYQADEAIILKSAFDVDGSGGNGSLNPNSTYAGWEWILVRSKGGQWKHVEHGY